MSIYSNSNTTTYHIIPIFIHTYFTLLHLSNDMSYYSEFQKNTSQYSNFQRPNITVLQFSHEHTSHYYKCHTTTYRIIPIFTRPHFPLFLFKKENMSHYSNCFTNTCHILPIITRTHVTLFQIQKPTCHNIPIVIRQNAKLFHFSEVHMSHFSNCHTIYYHIILQFRRPHVVFFEFSHDNLTYYSNCNT